MVKPGTRVLVIEDNTSIVKFVELDGFGVLNSIRQGGDRVPVSMLIAVNTQCNKMRIYKSASLLRPPRLSR